MVYSLQCFLSSGSQKSQMTLKIEKDSAGQKAIIRLSGRLQSEHLDELKTQSCSSMVAWRGSERLDRQRFDRTHSHQPEPRDRSKDNAQT
jgi:hypothetical protein